MLGHSWLTLTIARWLLSLVGCHVVVIVEVVLAIRQCGRVKLLVLLATARLLHSLHVFGLATLIVIGCRLLLLLLKHLLLLLHYLVFITAQLESHNLLVVYLVSR